MKNLFNRFSSSFEKDNETPACEPSALCEIKHKIDEIQSQIYDISHSANRAKNSSWYHLSENEIITSIYTGQFIIVDRRDLSITPSLVLTGEWEISFAQFFRTLIKPGNIVFDIGANVGYFGLISSIENGDGETHFFEANPELAILISKSCQLNALPRRKSNVHNKAIGRGKGFVTLRKPINLWGSASCHPNIFSDQQIFDVEYNVEMVSLDDFCASRGNYNCDIIKIDVEGYEEEVLNGMTRLIDSNENLCVLMEYTFGPYSMEFWGNLSTWFDQIHLFSEHDGIIEISDQEELMRINGNNEFCSLILTKKVIISMPL